MTSPDGTLMWDSTAIIEHLDPSTADDRSVIPEDSTLRFLAHLLDDFSDEWLYRPAVGSRWSYPANTIAAGWQITEELSAAIGLPGGMMRPNVVATMTASLPKLEVTPDNIDAWMGESFTPWLRALQAHLGDGYLLGDRPSIADFAVFGGNVAHFVGDPYCRDIVDEHAPAAVAHTHRLMMPHLQEFGDWIDAADVPETLIAVIAETGRHYLPWVAQATVDGSASVDFGGGVTATIESTPFLDGARGVMLARYVEARSSQLDEILEQAGVLSYFADHVDQATAVPDTTDGAHPTENRPYATS